MAENGRRNTFDKERRKKRMKCFAYAAAFAVFQTAVILVFALVVMKIRTPKFRVRFATFENFQVATLITNASFNTTMNAELSVKNANFGRYKYQNSTIEFTVLVANVPGNVLGNELCQHAWIPLTCRAKVKGKVTLMLMFKKNKSTNMNCITNLNISYRQLQDLTCR